MEFSEVKENTWIRYKGHIYYVSKVHHDYVDVMSLNYETIEIPDVVFNCCQKIKIKSIKTET